MAKATIKETALRLRYPAGLNEQGKEIFKTRSLSSLNPTASQDDIYGLRPLLDAVQSVLVQELYLTSTAQLHE